MSVVLVLGGARSGKSATAESLLGPDAVYVATGTADPGDADMAARIARHRDRRPTGWTTVETLDVVGALGAHRGEPVLVDSLGTWVAGHDGFAVDTEALLDALAGHPALVVVVSEEVGMGVHPETELGRRFRDALGELNRLVAERADRVLLVVAGRVLEL